jgi:hypothetical protein
MENMKTPKLTREEKLEQKKADLREYHRTGVRPEWLKKQIQEEKEYVDNVVDV